MRPTVVCKGSTSNIMVAEESYDEEKKTPIHLITVRPSLRSTTTPDNHTNEHKHEITITAK